MKKKAFGTHDIARICHVTPPTVGRWIEEGKMPSFETAGGHRRVWDEDLAAFLKTLKMPVPAELGDVQPSILIVDDEPEVRKLMLRSVQAAYGKGVDVAEAADGFEAGQKISNLKPSLVILDVQLPGVDGQRVCQMIRADGNLKSTRILAVSGHEPEETGRRMLKAGADAFLPKPFTGEELLAHIEKIAPDVAAGSRESGR